MDNPLALHTAVGGLLFGVGMVVAANCVSSITCCQTGVRGAHTWFVLRELLGDQDVRNYDGSWEDYTNRDDTPIES